MADQQQMQPVMEWPAEQENEHRCPVRFSLGGTYNLPCILARGHPNDHLTQFTWRNLDPTPPGVMRAVLNDGCPVATDPEGHIEHSPASNPDCEYSPEVLRWADGYAHTPMTDVETLAEALYEADVAAPQAHRIEIAQTVLVSDWLAEHDTDVRRSVAEEIAVAIEQSQSPLRVNPQADMVYDRAARTAREVGAKYEATDG